MARDDVQVNFRIPAELKARLEKAAEENLRTLTAELVSRLEASFTILPKLEKSVAAEERLSREISSLANDLQAFMLMSGTKPEEVRRLWQEGKQRLSTEKAKRLLNLDLPDDPKDAE